MEEAELRHRGRSLSASSTVAHSPLDLSTIRYRDLSVARLSEDLWEQGFSPATRSSARRVDQTSIPTNIGQLRMQFSDWLQIRLAELVNSASQSQAQRLPESGTAAPAPNPRGRARRIAAIIADDAIAAVLSQLNDEFDLEPEQGDPNESDYEFDGPSEATASPPTSTPGEISECGCSDIPQAMREAMRPGGRLTEVQVLSIVNQYGKLQDRADNRAQACYRHLRSLCGKLGMRTNIPMDTLAKRLRVVYENVHRVECVKMDNECYVWFRRNSRSVRSEDALGIYQFVSDVFRPRIARERTEAALRNLWLLSGVKSPEPLIKKWKTAGTIVVPDLFAWLRDSGLDSTIKQEFDMYMHHQRLISGRPNSGWLRNMYHSLVQQVVRSYPVYYMWYCALREDHPWRMISCPYYTKYAKPGDKTGFRHIGANVPSCWKMAVE
jgi:hypothetical protein